MKLGSHPSAGGLNFTRRSFDFHGGTHTLDPIRVIVGLAEQLPREFGRNWYALVTFANHRMVAFGPALTSPAPPEEVVNVMRACGQMLNYELHHDGCWIVVWHIERLAFMWRDADGDAAFICQVHEPWFRVRDWPTTEFCERAQAAWVKWHELVYGVFDRRPGESFKQALGQPSAGRSRP